MYSILLFDADDTILDFLKCERVALKLAMEDCGYQFKDEYIPLYSAVNLAMWKELERGEITKPFLIANRFKRFFNRAGIKEDAEPMGSQYMKRLSEQSFLLPGSKEMLETLHATGKYRLFLITNGIKATQTGRINGTGIKQLFEDIFISEEMGYEKPDVRYFNAVEERIPDFDRKSALVIGDSLTSDILGGNNARIDTVWFNAKQGVNTTPAKPTYEIRGWDELYKILEK